MHATAAVGHGLGALAGLAWAGVLGEAEVVEIADLRAQFLLPAAECSRRAHAPGDAQPGRAGGWPASTPTGAGRRCAPLSRSASGSGRRGGG